MTINLDTAEVVDLVDEEALNAYLAEEAVSHCVEMLEGDDISGIEIADALIHHVHLALRPGLTGDEDNFRRFLEDGIALMDDSIRSFGRIRQVLAEALADL